MVVFIKRRGWDSNPRALSDKRFSRPPRYDHFDTSPSIYLSAASVSPQRQDVFYHSFLLSSTLFSNFFIFLYFPYFPVFSTYKYTYTKTATDSFFRLPVTKSSIKYKAQSLYSSIIRSKHFQRIKHLYN